MSDAALVINAGSSSLKFSIYREEDEGRELHQALAGAVTGIGDAPRFQASGPGDRAVTGPDLDDVGDERTRLIDRVIDWLEERAQETGTLRAAGHRVVHGGEQYDVPVRIDDEVLERLDRLTPLAPLHQPYNLEPVRRLRQAHPRLLQVACFDTSFHRSQPEVAQWFAIPRHYRDEGVLRYGFHGLSYEYIARRLAHLDPVAAEGRSVVAHLGHGASLCALKNGRSIATTMGFTALDGLPMGRRCGSLDPGVVLYLIGEKGMSVKEVETLLYRESGLYGFSGISDDMHELLECSIPAAREAIELFCYRVVREIGSMVAALGGIDALVFTGGIGEHAAAVRGRVVESLGWLGAKLDEDANDRNDIDIAAPQSALNLLVIPTDEERMIAEHTLELARQ